MSNNLFIGILSITCIPLLIILFIWFINRYRNYKYIGNLYIVICIIFVVCYFYSLYLRLYPLSSGPSKIFVDGVEYELEPKAEADKPLQAILGAIFDAVKMFAMHFDTTKIVPFFKTDDKEVLQIVYHQLFFWGYLFAALSGLLSVSVLVVLIYFRNFTIRFNTLRRSAHRKKKIFYIFSDPKVTIATRLADAVSRDGDIVIFYLSRASQKTQEGSEYKEMLISKGFDVRVEAYGVGLAKWLFNKYFKKPYNVFARLFHLKTREVHVFGLFSNDDVANELGENFKDAVLANKKFIKAKKKIVFETNYQKDDDFEKEKNNIKGLIDKSNYTDDDLKNLADLANRIMPILGIDEVIDLQNKEIKKIIDEEKIHDGQFPLLLSKATKEANINAKDLINPTNKKLNSWIEMLNKFKNAKGVKEHELQAIENFRVFLTYHDGDMDLSHDNSSTTLHIVNTLSEYDMVSTEFVLNNQLNNFLNINPDMNVEEGKDNRALHVTFFGFGRINRPIFQKMTFAYQLWGDSVNKVHYHILDRNANSYLETVNNIYTIDKEKRDIFDAPLLYRVSAEEDDKDLTSYEVIDKYIKEISEQDNRFKKEGFEIFVVSLEDSAKSIQVTNCLRKAILKYNGNNRDSLLRAVIFVKISNVNMANSFYGSKPYVKDQDYINKGNLLKDDRKDEELVPIVIFGQNTIMSKYVDDYYKLIDKVGQSSQKAYYGSDTNYIRKKWLLEKKNSVLSNTTTVYSLKPKLALIGYELEQNIESGEYYIKPKDNAKNISSLNYYEDDIVKLIAALEHNRWMALEYLVHQYGQLDVNTYLQSLRMENGKIKYDTKDKEETKHVCMISNEGLKHLSKLMEAKSDTDHTLNREMLAAKAYRLTIGNDIDALKKALEAFETKNVK